MSRIFWDTMLFVYLVERHPVYVPRVEELLVRARRRGDSLYTSYLAIGELMAGSERSQYPEKAQAIAKTLREMGFTYLPFDAGAVEPFSKLRSKQKVKIADAIHLACAASAGIDLFLTGDKQLTKLDVPGIQFIVDFNTPVF
jgi:predicted nucleic acid-binding protein